MVIFSIVNAIFLLVPGTSSLSTTNMDITNMKSLSPSPVELTYRQNTVQPCSYTCSMPPTLFLHGLDSSSHTWRNTLSDLESRAVALDLRGCGRSPLGDANEFCPDAIVNDIYAFLATHPYFHDEIKTSSSASEVENGNAGDNKSIKPFVLVGHSMGGRIAMSFATRYPSLTKAVVIEDMDIRQRPMEMNIFQSKDRDGTITFQRELEGVTNEKSLTELYAAEGYPPDSVAKWLKEGRIVVEDVSKVAGDGDRSDQEVYSYYSEVNPAFRLLCYEQFFITNHGEEMWRKLAQQSMAGIDFPIHVMVADQDKTVCDENSIWEMKKIMKEEGNGRFMAMHRYKGATHSIHNSSSKEFLKDLRTIIRNASLG